MTPLTIIARRQELNPAQRIWGTGGWVIPEEREALDWLTLGILLGWDPVVLYGDAALPEAALSSSRVVVVAMDPSELPAASQSALRSVVERHPVTVVLRRPASDAAQVTRAQCGLGQIVTLGFHPSELRDASGRGTALLRDLLITTSPVPVEWRDLSGVMILRMDDPGGAQNVYSKSWCYPKLTSQAWQEIGAELRAYGASLSIGYVPGWVDDGAEDRGRIWISGQETLRVPGAVYPSRLVRHYDLAGHAPGRVNDYEDEYRSIRSLISARLASAELHGFTHLHPDRATWLTAPDRYEALHWFRELGAGPAEFLASKQRAQHPVVQGMTELEATFGAPATTLICPGEEFTLSSLEVAMDSGIRLVGSYYLGIRWHDHLCWATHVCSPYLDQPSASWFDSGLPVVGYFHDKELAEEGVGWFGRNLKEWRRCGARLFIDYAGLAKHLSPGTGY